MVVDIAYGVICAPVCPADGLLFSSSDESIISLPVNPFKEVLFAKFILTQDCI